MRKRKTNKKNLVQTKTRESRIKRQRKKVKKKKSVIRWILKGNKRKLSKGSVNNQDDALIIYRPFLVKKFL